MEKLLISCKFNSNAASDVVGGSLPNILFANFFKQILNHKIILHDPFFNSNKLLKPFCDEIISSENIDFRDFNRVVSPLFYIGDLRDKTNNKVYNIEGRYSFNKRLKIKKKNIQIIQGKNYYIKDRFDPILNSKSFDIPYHYYYDWMARENFKPDIEFKKLPKIPIKKSEVTYSVQIRKQNHKIFENNLIGDDYDDYLKKLILKIKKKDPSSNIIIYGLDEKTNFNNKNLLDFLNNKKAIQLENYSNNPLERAAILAKYSNIILSTINGFSCFAKYLGYYSGNLKKIQIINSEPNLEKMLHARRALSDGIAEKNFQNNSYFWSKFKILKDNKIENLQLDFKKKFNFKKKIFDKYLIYYDLKNLDKYYFSYKIDNYFFQELLKNNKKIFKKHKILVYKNNNKIELNGKRIRKKIDFSKCQHVLTHYNLIKNYNNEKLSKDSLDFNKPTFIQKLIKKKKLNTSNLFYDDLSTFVFRECKKNKNIKTKSKLKKILFIDENKNHNNTNLFSKIFMRTKEESIKIDWNNIIEKYKQQIGIDCDVLTYLDNENLHYQSRSKKIKISFSISNLKKIIKNYEVIICRPSNISLLIKFFFKNKSIVLFEVENISKKIINDNLFLNRNYNYLDIFDCKFNNFRELNLFLFKKYTEF